MSYCMWKTQRGDKETRMCELKEMEEASREDKGEDFTKPTEHREREEMLKQ